MTGILVLVGFMLLALIVLVPLLVRMDNPRPTIQPKTLREIESDLADIQSLTTDVYARGKAAAAREKARKALDDC